MASTPARASGRARGALILAAAAFVVALNLTPISESDFWIQQELGGMIRASGTIPRTILFAFTEARDYEFIAHEWLATVASSALYDLIGYRGMIVFKCTMALLLAALCFLLALRLSGSVVIAVLVASLAELAANFRIQMRPELYAFVLLMIELNLLHEFLRTKRRAWLAALLPLGLIWANTHGSFLIGLALPALILAGEAIDDLRSGRLAGAKLRTARLFEIHVPLAAIAAALFAVSLINPYGLRLHRHVLTFGRADYLHEQIVEFGSTFAERVRATPYFKVYAAYLGLLLCSFVLGRRKLRTTPLLLFLAFGYLSTDAIRLAAWLALAGCWALAHNLSAVTWPDRRRFALALTALLLAGTVLVAVRGDVRRKRIGFRDESPMSAATIDFIRRAGIRGNVFNGFNQGDPLIFHFYPDIRVVIDSRIDAYGESYYLWYRKLEGRSYKQLGPPGMLLDFLDRHGVHAIVTRPFDYWNWEEAGHLSALMSSGWRLVYADERTVILTRAGQSREDSSGRLSLSGNTP